MGGQEKQKWETRNKGNKHTKKANLSSNVLIISLDIHNTIKINRHMLTNLIRKYDPTISYLK
jgi:hypothetical protein